MFTQPPDRTFGIFNTVFCMGAIIMVNPKVLCIYSNDTPGGQVVAKILELGGDLIRRP